MYDIFSNHKIAVLRALALQSIGAADQTIVDLQEVSDLPGLRERTTRGLLLIDVTSVDNGGLLDLVLKDSPDGVTYDTDFITIPQIDAAGLYAIDVDGINRNFTLASTITVDGVTWGAVFIGFDAQRRPVKQTDITVLTPVYAANRKG